MMKMMMKMKMMKMMKMMMMMKMPPVGSRGLPLSPVLSRGLLCSCGRSVDICSRSCTPPPPACFLPRGAPQRPKTAPDTVIQ